MTGKGEDGYVLGYFMILLMVIMIFVTSVMSLSFGYYSRTVKDKYRKQAFYTARSVAQVLAEECISREEENDTAGIMEELYEFGDIELSGLPDEMGECVMRLEYEKDTRNLYIWITASVKDQKGIAAAVLHWENGSGETDSTSDNGGWELIGYINEERKHDEILEGY
ncbi:MAG: hypothetical protein KH366_22675 [Clostridiaceae bacterium]|nr:hypothetical protein [Clostridiaceae bacterium]